MSRNYDQKLLQEIITENYQLVYIITPKGCQEEAYVQPTEEAGKCNHLFKHAKNSKDPQQLFQSRL